MEGFNAIERTQKRVITLSESSASNPLTHTMLCRAQTSQPHSELQCMQVTCQEFSVRTQKV